MIITVEELKQYVKTDKTDQELEAMIQAVESAIRKHTNNNFMKPGFRLHCPIMAQKLYLTTNFFEVGDTVQIYNSIYNDGVYTITEIDDDFITLSEKLMDESMVAVTKVEYPMEVKMGAINMLKFDLKDRGKGDVVQSETISRHSVTYVQQTADNTSIGYPKTVVDFMKHYKKARF